MKVAVNSNTVDDKQAMEINCIWHQKILIQATKYGSETRTDDTDDDDSKNISPVTSTVLLMLFLTLNVTSN